jgi:Cytochrome C oxidase, cbb3-type, subunit III
MSTNSPLKFKLRKFVFAALLILICVLIVYSLIQQNKPWIVPEEYKALKNPLLPSEPNLNSAKQIYSEECAQCHGEHGKGDGPEARTHAPLPADLTDSKRMATVTDGEIFYQISEGRRPMPSFKNRLTQDQRWQLVLLVRSFSQASIAPIMKPEAPDTPPQSNHKL